MQLEEESTRIAQGLTLRIATPERGLGGVAVGADGGGSAVAIELAEGRSLRLTPEEGPETDLRCVPLGAPGRKL